MTGGAFGARTRELLEALPNNASTSHSTSGSFTRWSPSACA